MRINKNLNVTHISNRYIGNKNFAGEARRFNDAGKRNFNLYLDDPNATYMYGDEVYDVSDETIDENGHTALDRLIVDLESDGWNVKQMPADPSRGWDSHPYIKVNLNLHQPSGRNPEVFLVNRSNNAVAVEENAVDDFMDNIGHIDWMNISVRPYNYDWRENGNHQTAFATVLYFKFVETNIWADMYR